MEKMLRWLWAPTLVVLAAVLSGVWGSDPCAKYANGCSTPFGLRLSKTDFTPACNKHDVCYRCGAVYGIKRRQCDSKFLQNMNAVCAANGEGRRRSVNAVLGIPIPGSADSREKRSTCSGSAKVFYRAVRTFGWLYYKKRKTYPFCSEPDVRRCL